MRSDGNVQAWLAEAPADVAETTTLLLERVADLRTEQDIYPPQNDILNALAWTAPREVSVVILGQDPYHEPGQAMGLSFSVPEGCKIPPSLRNIYKELATDLGCPAPTSGDLTPWAEQGVLLLNTTLTVRAHAANSHSKLGWQVLTHHVVRRCMELPQPVVFLAWGRPSATLIESARQHVHETGGDAALATKFVLASTHPSPLSANRAAADMPAFMGSRPFSRANHLLSEHGVAPIDWRRVG